MNMLDGRKSRELNTLSFFLPDRPMKIRPLLMSLSVEFAIHQRIKDIKDPLNTCSIFWKAQKRIIIVHNSLKLHRKIPIQDSHLFFTLGSLQCSQHKIWYFFMKISIKESQKNVIILPQPLYHPPNSVIHGAWESGTRHRGPQPSLQTARTAAKHPAALSQQINPNLPAAPLGLHKGIMLLGTVYPLCSSAFQPSPHPHLQQQQQQKQQ